MEAAISAAEAYAKGDATLTSEELWRNSMSSATAAIRTVAGSAKPDFSGRDAVQASADAIVAALGARQMNQNIAVAGAVSAYTASWQLVPFGHVAATLDLRRLLTLGVGSAPDLGLPVDPTDSGPLGPLE
jgi:hypothetical protein